jgi:hypothetical protein
MQDMISVTALWWAVIVSGLYHGLNPGMGWPLAVSAALMERKPGALVKALGPLAFGHFLAMTAILLPFSLMTVLVMWEREIRLIAGLLVIGLGVYLLINRKHPRFLARVKPSRLALWSFLAAMAHGAGLMLVPIFLGICKVGDLDAGHTAAMNLMGGNVGMAVAVSVVHAAAMIVSGGAIAWAVFKWLGPQFISKSWFNLDLVWAVSLILVGGLGLWGAL